MLNRQFGLGIALVLALTTISAAEKEKTKVKKPVQDAPKVEKGYVPRAEITITEGKEQLVKEYRINGMVRAIKVTPKNGFPAYYLIDHEGNGNFVKLGPDMGKEISVPNWILVEW